MKNEINYLADITIDQNALDLEWLDQPSLAFRYAEHASEMKRIVDIAKEDLDLVCAELDREIRKIQMILELGKLLKPLFPIQSRCKNSIKKQVISILKLIMSIELLWLRLRRLIRKKPL